MELTITEKRENPMFDRTEVYFTIDHPKAATPPRQEIRKALAANLNAKDGVVILDWARSEFGRTVTRGYAKVYASRERALAIETTPILIRNGLKAAEVKAAVPAKEAPAPPPKKEASKKEEKPKEEPPKREAKPEKREEAPKVEVKEKKEAPKKEEAKEKPPKEKAPPKEKKAGKEEK